MAEHIHHLADAIATCDLGRRLAGELLEQPGAGPALLLLQGDLGAGKTCLVQGLAEGLGISEAITSPTFALAQHYDGRLSDGRPTRLIHLDLYRLEEPAAADELFAQEEEEAAALAASVTVVLAVEWPERLSVLPQDAWRLRLEHHGMGRRVHWHGPA
jgi:tRNA threonylcarbamoyladenosine biosynthesis protein TsaE